MRGALVKGTVMISAAMMLAACAGGSFVALDGAAVGVAETPRLDGVYKATVMAPLLGPVHARLTAEPTNEGFRANTRPGVAWSMIGGIEGVLGQIFAPFLFPGGVILTWESGVPNGGEPAEGWISAGQLRNARMQTKMVAADKPIELFSRDGRRVGLISLEPAHADDPPFADYRALATGIEEAITTRLYDPSLADSAQVRGFVRQVHRSAGLASDDVEFIFGVGAAAYRNIKFPWPIVAKKDDPSLRPEDWSSSDLGTMRIRILEDSNIATVKVDAFLDASDVDLAFEKVIELDATGIKLDLLTTPGVTMASLRVISWLIDEPVNVGTFFTAPHREAVQAGDVDQFPTMEITTADSVALAETALDVHGAINIIIHPGDRRYTRPVAAVTTDKTATSTEPLIWALKNHTQVSVHGSATAGHPQLSRPIDLGQDWVVWLATADYRPPSGENVARGIQPHFPQRSRSRARSDAVKRILVMAKEQRPATRLTSQPATPTR